MFRPLILAGTLLLTEASAGVLETRDGKSFSGAIQLVAPDKLRIPGGGDIPLTNVRRAVLGSAAPSLIRLKNLTATFYPGDWESLPDFASLKPQSSHLLPGGRITLHPYQSRAGYALVIQGTLELPTNGAHQFNLGSDDGSRLMINGKTVIDNDGRHGLRFRQGKIELRPGRHAFRLEYFNAADTALLALDLTPPGLPRMVLSGPAARTPIPSLAIPGPGVLLWNGSFIARPISGWTDARILFAGDPPSLRLSTINATAIFYQGLPAARLQPFRGGRPSILQRGGKYLEGKIEPGEKNSIIIHTVLLGRRTLTAGSGTAAVLLQKPGKPVAGYHIRTRDGTHAIAQKPVIEKNAILLNEPPFVKYRIPAEDVLEIRHGTLPHPLQAAWDHYRQLDESGRNLLNSQASSLENAAYSAAQARLQHITLQRILEEATAKLIACEKTNAIALSSRIETEQAALKSRDAQFTATTTHETAQAALPALLAARDAALSPALPALEQRLLARVLARKKDVEEFHPLELINATGPEGLEFEKQPDGSLLANPSLPGPATYTLEFKTMLKTITGIRLEALPDPSLNKKGPGHAGNFMLNDVRLLATDQAKLDPAQHLVPLAGARANFSQTAKLAAHAIDRKAGAADFTTGWAIDPQTGKTHQLILNTATPLVFKGPVTLRIELDQLQGKGHNLGHFRLTARTGQSPSDDGVTTNLLASVALEPHKRSSTQRAAALAWFRQLHPGVKYTGDPATLPPPPDTEAITKTKADAAAVTKKASADLAALEIKWATDLKKSLATTKSLTATALKEKTNTVTATTARLSAATTLAAAKKRHAEATSSATAQATATTTAQTKASNSKTAATQAASALTAAKRDHDSKKNLAATALKAHQQAISSKQKPALTAVAKARREHHDAENAHNAAAKRLTETTNQANEARALHQAAATFAATQEKAADGALKKFDAAEANRKKDEQAAAEVLKKTQAAQVALTAAVNAQQTPALEAWKNATNTLAKAEAAKKAKPEDPVAIAALKTAQDAQTKAAAVLKSADAEVKRLSDIFQKSELVLEATEKKANDSAAIAATQLADKNIAKQLADVAQARAAKLKTSADTLGSKTLPAAKAESASAKAALTKAQSVLNTANQALTRANSEISTANSKRLQTLQAWEQAQRTMEAAQAKVDQTKDAQAEADKQWAAAKKQLVADKATLAKEAQAIKTAEAALKSAETNESTQLTKAAEAQAAVLLNTANHQQLKLRIEADRKAAQAAIAKIQTDLSATLKSMNTATTEASKAAEVAMAEFRKKETALLTAQTHAHAAQTQLESSRTSYTKALKDLADASNKLAQTRAATSAARVAVANARRALEQFQLSNRQALGLR